MASPVCISIFADESVGCAAFKFVLSNHPEHIRNVVTTGDNEITSLARAHGIPVHFYRNLTPERSRSLFKNIDYIFLAWWPHIIPRHLIKMPSRGVINFHPSLLPYDRGKNYNFWTIVENTPFGVSLHFVDEGVDTGPVIFQESIEKSWEDTGETLYRRAKTAIIDLFEKHYLDIIEGRYVPIPQNASVATRHSSKELDPASMIDLDRRYRARDLLNLLRARTFAGMPACYFFDDGMKYEVRVSIIETDNGSD